MLSRLERLANTVGNDPKLLEYRLRQAYHVLLKEYRTGIEKFSFEEKRLYLKGNKYFLQWQVREYPALEDSYSNQQTSIGNVTLEEIL